MSLASRRLTVLAASAGGVGAVLATVALATSGPVTALADTAPYGTASPVSGSPSASASSSVSPSPEASPAPEAVKAVDDVIASLPPTVSDADKALLKTALDNAAKTLAATGLTPAQQATAIALVGDVTKTAASDPNLSQAQKLAAVNTTTRIADDLAKLPTAQQTAILSGLKSGILGSTTHLIDAGTQKAVGETLSQAITALSASGHLDVLTPDVVSRLVSVTAGAVDGKTSGGSSSGVKSTATPGDDGSVHFTFSGLKPGSTALVVLNVTDAKVTAALRAAYGNKVVAAALDAAGRGTLVLTGTVDENGNLVLTAPGSALGATNGAQAQTALGKTVLGVVGTTANGTSAVFATGAGASKPAAPSIAVKTPVVNYRNPAVLAGTAQPGTTVQLLGRAAGGSYKVLRSVVVPTSGQYSFTVFPNGNMRFVVRSVLGGVSNDSPSTVVNVRPTVTEVITRTAAKTFRFSGRVAPVSGPTMINVYLNNAKGSVLVARTLTKADGTWAVVRRFSTGGVYFAFTRSAATATTIAGSSPVRAVTIN